MNKIYYFILLILIIINPSNQLRAQFDNQAIFDIDENDLNIGGDIFSDFNEDLEASQVFEDERFYRYGRFYAFNIMTGITTFTGNRGQAYTDENPSLGASLLYFLNFTTAFGLGVGFSKHNFVVNVPTKLFNFEGGPGLVEVNMFRVFFFYRYYLDTSDLGTAITYSNPYFTGRVEYWNQTNKYIDRTDIANDSNGALGLALGVGLEFPIEIKESYFGVEALYHFVNFNDTYTQDFRATNAEEEAQGIQDLRGDSITVFVSYVINW